MGDGHTKRSMRSLVRRRVSRNRSVRLWTRRSNQRLASLDGAAGPLLRQMEQLLEASDRESDFTFMLSPSFLLSDARSVLPSISKGAQDLVREISTNVFKDCL